MSILTQASGLSFQEAALCFKQLLHAARAFRGLGKLPLQSHGVLSSEVVLVERQKAETVRVVG